MNVRVLGGGWLCWACLTATASITSRVIKIILARSQLWSSLQKPVCVV